MSAWLLLILTRNFSFATGCSHIIYAVKKCVLTTEKIIIEINSIWRMSAISAQNWKFIANDNKPSAQQDEINISNFSQLNEQNSC